MATSGEKPTVAATASTKALKAARHVKDKFGDLSVEDPGDVVRFGYITQEEAKAVWTGALGAWGVGDSSTKDRDELKKRVSQAILISTSKDEENLDTRFKLPGTNRYVTLRVLHDLTAKAGPGANDSYLRVFARSYDYGLFACMNSDMLKDPRNVELRQDLAVRCGGTVEDAYLMSDIFEATYVLAGRQYTTHELSKAQRYRIARTEYARVRATDAGFAGPRNDSNAREQGKTVVEGRNMPVPKAPASTRTAFAPVNPRD